MIISSCNDPGLLPELARLEENVYHNHEVDHVVKMYEQSKKTNGHSEEDNKDSIMLMDNMTVVLCDTLAAYLS